MRVLVTGASGFVGRALCFALLAKGHLVRAALRTKESFAPAEDIEIITVGEMCGYTDWSNALERVDLVIHCSGLTHAMEEFEGDALATYREVNVRGTRRLAEQAVVFGVRRLVFLSSIKVLGEKTALGVPFLFSDAPKPESLYGVSKWEAEQALWKISERLGLEVVVVRPPLVYGPEVKGNLLRLLRLAARGTPLPLGAVHNQRSLVGLSNLVDMLLCCAEHPAAAEQTFLVSDGQDLSIAELICLMAEGMNQTVRLLPVPVTLLQAAGLMLGKRDKIERLVASLQVDSGYTQCQLGWAPRVSVEDGVRQMARWYFGWQEAHA